MRRFIANWTQAAGRAAKKAVSLLGIAPVAGLALLAGLYAPMPAFASAPIASCGTCHGFPPIDWRTTLGKRNGANGQFLGSHNTHAGAWYTNMDSRYGMSCEVCHVAPLYTWYSHQTDTVQLNLRWLSLANGAMQSGSVAGWGSYSKWTSFRTSNNPTYGTCENTYCHSNGSGGTWQTGEFRAIEANVSPMWGTDPNTTPRCFPCHGHETGNPGTGAPWYTSSYAAAGGRKANSHQKHAWQTVGQGPVCYRCHYATTGNGMTITSVGNHIKRSYTVAPGPGVNYTYSYYTNGGICASVSCHGGNTMKWGTGIGPDCTGCHGAGFGKFPKTLSIGTIRQVIGTGGDFDMAVVPTTGSRHLYGATTIIKWDCVVCHREGALATGSTSSYHNEGTAPNGGIVNLRNVDTTNEAVGFDIDNKRWNTTDYKNLDQFCLACHDVDGASAVAVKATNNGMLLDTSAWGSIRNAGIARAAFAPFNSTDWRSGFIAASTHNPDAGFRSRVINVKDQFYAGTASGASYNGNPSQHAVIGVRYTTTSSWAAAAWSAYTTKKTKQDLTVVREKALLSCADCHVLDAGEGGHGGESRYNLWTTDNPQGFCMRCHSSTAYSAGGTANGSRYNHDYTRATSYTGYGLAVGGCLICHASYDITTTLSRNNSYGGIHGSWSSTAKYQGYAGGSTLNTLTQYRFFPGAWRKQNFTDGDTGWAGTTTSQCYFASNNDAFSSCTSHSGSTSAAAVAPGSMPSYGRPVKY